MKELILFRVSMGNIKVFTYAFDREGAKRNAFHWIGRDKELYIVEPLTNPGDRIHLSITLFV